MICGLGEKRGEHIEAPQILITDQVHKGHTKLNILTVFLVNKTVNSEQE